MWTGKCVLVGEELLDEVLGDVLGHDGQLTASTQLGALNEATETTSQSEACSVDGILLAGTQLGGHQRDVVAILVPPNLASVVKHRVGCAHPVATYRP